MIYAAMLSTLFTLAPVTAPNGAQLILPAAPEHPSAFDRGQHVSRQRALAGLDAADNLTLGEFWVTSGLYSLALNDGIFADMARLDDDTVALIQPALLAGTLGGAYFLTHMHTPLRAGVLAGITYGTLAGYLNGAMLGLAIAPDGSFNHRLRWMGASGFVLSTLGGATGGYLAHRLGATKDDIALISTSTLWGAVAALTVPLMVDSMDERAFAGTVLAGSLLGGGLGAGLAATLNVSRARTYMLDLGAIAGLSVAATIASTTSDSSQTLGAALLAGELVGLATGAILSKNMAIPDIHIDRKIHVGAGPLPVMGARSEQRNFVPGLMLQAAL